MKFIQFIGVVIFCISTDIGANDAWNSNWTWGGQQWDATSTGGISRTLLRQGGSIETILRINDCVRNPDSTFVDDCDRYIRRAQARSHQKFDKNRNLRYQFSVRKSLAHGDATQGGYINFFEIKPWSDGKTHTVPTVALYINPKTNQMNLIQSLGNHGANPASQNDIYTALGRMGPGWNNFRIETNQSTGTDGYLRIYQNGQLIYSYRGKTTYAHSRPIKYWIGSYICCKLKELTNEPDHIFVYKNVQAESVFNSVVEPQSNFSTYVDKYGDLLAAYNATGSGQSKATWGKRHYCNYGHGEGRSSSGLTSSVCATTLATTSPTIKVSVKDVLGRGNRFSTEITRGVGEFSKTAVFNGDIFSFKDYETFRAIKVRENQGLMLGFPKHRDKDGVLHDPVGIGWLFDDVALMVAQDNSIFGYRAEGVFDFKDPSTTYVDVGYRKKLTGKAMLYTDLMYAFGRSRPGELTTLSHLHALGLETRLDIRANWRNRFQFRFDLPLRIEHGSSRFYVEQEGRVHPLVIDLAPAARQSSLSFNHSYRLSRKSQLISDIHYIHNPDHRRGTDGYRAHLRVQYRF